MTIDRSKFKATSVAVVQQQDKELSSMTGKKNERAGYLKIKPGKNSLGLLLHILMIQ